MLGSYTRVFTVSHTFNCPRDNEVPAGENYSGAMWTDVPLSMFVVCAELTVAVWMISIVLLPKSTSLQIIGSFSHAFLVTSLSVNLSQYIWLEMRMFRGFKSRWTMLLSRRYLRPRAVSSPIFMNKDEKDSIARSFDERNMTNSLREYTRLSSPNGQKSK